MCWSEKVSRNTFILGTIINIYLALRRMDNKAYLLMACFCQLIITVQLGETLIWKDPTCGSVGTIGSKISFYSVYLQPIMGLLFFYLIYGFNNVYTKIGLILFAIYMVASISVLPTLTICSKPEPCCDDKQHLSDGTWDRAKSVSFMYMVMSVWLLVCLPIVDRKYLSFSLYLVGTGILSKLFYKNSFASMWCFFSVAAPIVLYLSV